ncbi:MAG: TonB-dependent receptor plug domain-containing protein [Campylobacterota bacterium]|nr:TonB-dependent receptor plug domain-containing protein [Campylobacterota bacterium]
MKKVLVGLLSIVALNAQDINLDNLLDTFAKNSDLSKKTKLENSGHTIVYTRDDIDRMMAKNLKDILKSYPTIGYRESRFGYPDILNMGGSLPFTSSPIRIMIDDHEVTTAFNSGGFALLGDIDLGFVDHIEIYAHGPSFEHSSELTYILIKLYSKTPQRDMGKKIELNTGTNGYNFQSAYVANQLDDFSYFTYISRVDDKKERYASFDDEINRDQERYHLFTSLYKDNYTLKLQAIKNEKHMSLNYSYDGTPNDDITQYRFYNFSYDYKPNEDFVLAIDYSNAQSESSFSDDTAYFCMEYNNICMYSTNIDVNEDILTTSLKYTINHKSNNLVLGVSNVLKHFDFDKLQLNDIDMAKDDFTKQNISSVFAENKYMLYDNQILTLATKYNNVQNNGSIDDIDFFLFRAGYTYTNNDFASKTFIYNTTSLIEPHIIKSNFSSLDDNLKEQKMQAISQEFKYKKDKALYSLVTSFSEVKNSIYQNSQSKIVNSDDIMKVNATYFDFNYNFNKNHKIIFDMSYTQTKNIPYIGDVDQYSSFVRVLNSIGKFDIFNELIYRFDDSSKEDSYDYSVGCNFKYTKDLKFYIKGENLLDKAYTDKFSRVSIDWQTHQTEIYTPISISPIDKKVIIGMEYLF